MPGILPRSSSVAARSLSTLPKVDRRSPRRADLSPECRRARISSPSRTAGPVVVEDKAVSLVPHRDEKPHGRLVDRPRYLSLLIPAEQRLLLFGDRHEERSQSDVARRPDRGPELCDSSVDEEERGDLPSPAPARYLLTASAIIAGSFLPISASIEKRLYPALSGLPSRKLTRAATGKEPWIVEASSATIQRGGAGRPSMSASPPGRPPSFPSCLPASSTPASPGSAPGPSGPPRRVPSWRRAPARSG